MGSKMGLLDLRQACLGMGGDWEATYTKSEIGVCSWTLHLAALKCAEEMKAMVLSHSSDPGVHIRSSLSKWWVL